MTLERLMNQPCTVTTVTGDDMDRDSQGNPGRSTSDTETVCYAEQIQATDATVLGDVQETRWLFLLPLDTVVNGLSVITLGGDVYAVDGPPWPVWNPRRRTTTHLECHAIATGAG